MAEPLLMLTYRYGDDDEDVLDIRKGIAALVYDGWTDEQIAAVALEEAQAIRQEMSDALSGGGEP